MKEYDDILEVNNNKQSRHYLYDGFGLAVQDSKIALLDHLGSAINMYGAINDEVQPRIFDEFGNSNNINDGEIGYTGYLYDEVSNLNYAQARFYDSQNARFNGLDNIVNFDEKKTGFNRYTYVLNNPNRYVDKDGNAPWDGIFGYNHIRDEIPNTNYEGIFGYFKNSRSKGGGSQFLQINTYSSGNIEFKMQLPSIKKGKNKYGLGNTSFSAKFGAHGINNNLSIGADLGKYGSGVSVSTSFLNLFGGDPELAGLRFQTNHKNNHNGSSSGLGLDLGLMNGGLFQYWSQKEGSFDSRYETGSRLPKYWAILVIPAAIGLFVAGSAIVSVSAGTGVLKGASVIIGLLLSLFESNKVDGSTNNEKK